MQTFVCRKRQNSLGMSNDQAQHIEKNVQARSTNCSQHVYFDLVLLQQDTHAS
jgi:hypothetical protein